MHLLEDSSSCISANCKTFGDELVVLEILNACSTFLKGFFWSTCPCTCTCSTKPQSARRWAATCASFIFTQRRTCRCKSAQAATRRHWRRPQHWRSSTHSSPLHLFLHNAMRQERFCNIRFRKIRLFTQKKSVGDTILAD